MLKKTITFKDFNDNEVTEDHYFHLSRADIATMEFSEKGGLSKKLEQIIADEDGGEIMRIFEELIRKSYGKKSEDGRQFIKNDELRQAFMQSNAYEALFMELVTNAGAAAAFANGIIPQEMAEQVRRQQDQPQTPQSLAAPRGVRGGEPEGPIVQDPGPDVARPADGGPGVPRVLTRKEVLEMPQAELSHLLATGQAVIGSEG